MVQRRRLLSALGPAVYLSFFWIAPWYGFFKPPAFRQAILYPCEGRSALTTGLSIVAMVTLQIAGRRLASWMQRA